MNHGRVRFTSEGRQTVVGNRWNKRTIIAAVSTAVITITALVGSILGWFNG